MNVQDSMAISTETQKDTSAGEQFQALMRRVWLDNALATGGQGMHLLLSQIVESAANSQQLIKALHRYPEQKKVLQREWELKDQELQKLINALLEVQAQIRRERQILWCKE